MTTAMHPLRRESHLASVHSFSDGGMRHVLAAYRNNKFASVIPEFEFKPGFVYASVRAISARINQNFDGWPSDELKKSYRSFLGKPCFVNHQNFDPTKARGKVVAARYVEAGDDKYIETVMEIDAMRFPKLAREIKEGGMDSVSMGVEAGFTICSYCGNKAVDVPEFCDHVKYHKGSTLQKRSKTGAVEDVLIYEKCYKLGFFELSFVFDPADETAVVNRVIAAGKRQATPDRWFEDEQEELNRQRRREEAEADAWAEKRINTPHPDDQAYWKQAAPQDPTNPPNLNALDGDVSSYKPEFPEPVTAPQPKTPMAPLMGEAPNMLEVGTGVMENALHAGEALAGESHSTPHAPSGETSSSAAGASAGPSLSENSISKTHSLAALERRIERMAAEGDVPPNVIILPDMITPEMPTGMMPQASYRGAGSGWNDFHELDMHRFPDHWAPVTPPAKRPRNPEAEAKGYSSDLGHGYSRAASLGAIEASIDRLAYSYAPPKKTKATEPVKKKKKHPFRDLFKPDEDDGESNEMLKNAPWYTYANQRTAYGEIEAPEDVDTLRNEEDDDNDDFKHYVQSPKELRGPDLDQTKRLDRDQESEGLDTDRRVEDVEDVSGPPTGGNTMASRNARRARRRNSGRQVYAEGLPMDPSMLGGDPSMGGGMPPMDPSMMGGDPSMGGPPPGAGGPPVTDEELIQEAEADLELAEQQGTPNAPPQGGQRGEDEGYSDEDDEDEESDEESDEDYEDEESEGDEDYDDEGEESEDDDYAEDGASSEDLPPWLQEGLQGVDEDPSAPPLDKESRRRSGNRRVSSQKNRREGVPMNLSQRGRVAAAGQRRHYADDSGHTDGGPYGDESQGTNEEVFLSQTPSAEAVVAPVPGDGTISNSENTLVAKKLQRRIQQRNVAQRRDLVAWEQITGRRVNAEAVDSPEQVDPALSGTDQQDLKGDFESLGEAPTETQPKDASVRAFRAFDNWLTQTTGKTARQHGNPNFIRRSAARFCQASGLSVESMFPALGIVLREARRNEGNPNRRSAMRRYADESLDVAAPQGRIDVEAPVKDTTDADAQASQFDLGDFGNNAGDNVADPELSADSQIWAPGEGDSSIKSSNRKADGMTAVRYAEAYIAAGLAPNTSEEKWKIAGLAQTMRHGTIVDRTRLLDAINIQRAASARRTASRGTGRRSVPPGFGQRQLTAGSARDAANDLSTDAALFFKG